MKFPRYALGKTLVVKRAHQNSPFGKENRDLAFAVDAHQCLLFLCKKTEDPNEFDVVPVGLEGETFDHLYEKFLIA